jgi:cobalamin synthase
VISRFRPFRLVISHCKTLRDFFTAVPGSLRNHLNAEELYRISVTALSTGGGVFGLLQAVLLGVGNLFPAPTDAALAALVLTTILDSLRRLHHGDSPVRATVAARRTR